MDTAALRSSSLVSDAARIGHLLLRLVETRAPLTLTAGARIRNTLLLALDFKSGELVLDEPFPQLALPVGEAVHLKGRVDGSVVEFETLVRRTGEHQGARSLIAAVPRRVQHHERRSRYRLQIPSDLFLPPTLFSGREGSFRGRLVDISETGVASVVSEVRPEVGGILACSLSLPGTRLIADAQVCSTGVGGGASASNQRLGLRFAGLSAHQLNAITRAIAQLDRQLLRRYTSAAWV